jgi:hypothetical protein
MMLKRSTTKPKPSVKARLVRAGMASLAAASAIAALATGCLDRPVVKAEPKTSNVFVDLLAQTAVDKIDLLFMIDNSVSMADKQDILKSAVPLLLKRLVTPNCLDGMGNPTGATANSDGMCPNNQTVEFNAIGDIHIGIVSSSLGAHGGMVCATPMSADDHLDDKAHLIGTVRTGVAGYNNLGFLAWDHKGTANNPPGEKDPTALNTAFVNMIGAVGEHGCGYEASLESWYRFLVDPEPPEMVTLQGQTTVRGSKLVIAADGTQTCMGCDATLLAQRKSFLRPDSLVAIVMLSDENDCSIRDDSVGWFVGSGNRMPLSTKVCETDPNNKCCRSCALNEAGPPDGCPALSADETCKTVPAGQKFATWDALHDNPNLRCYNQHQRFGFDLLYETGRYVNALTNPVIQLQSNPNASVTNPLYDNTGSSKAPRDPSLVFLAGIVGVPWQDIADDASLTGPGLNYLTAKELATMTDAQGHNRWEYLLGSPHASPVGLPLDPFMIETTTDRTTLPGAAKSNTLAKPAVPLVDAKSMKPDANAINGHEQNIPDFADLQYACIFPKASKVCMGGDAACDCSPTKMGDAAAVTAANSPLCQPPTGGPAGTTQYSAKAYPGARELTVLKDFGENAIVASICPKIATDTTKPDYGYNPAVGAIIARLKEALKGKCLPRKLATDEVTHQALCKVIEAKKSSCDCTIDGRGPADPLIQAAVQAQLKENGSCGNGTQDACESWCECEIKQVDPADLLKCQASSGAPHAGYCYVDASAVTAAGDNKEAAALISDALSKCPENQPQLLRFVPGDQNVVTPAQGAVAFIACLGGNVQAGQ